MADQEEKQEPNKKSEEKFLDSKISAFLSYLLGFITGFIFLIIAKDDSYVKFHATQSIFFSITFFIVKYLISSYLFPLLINASPSQATLISIFNTAVNIVFLILWVILLIMAYTGKKWELPILGQLARKISEK
ncbi:MAG: DUF4870 domain-containing protein [Patescibacteria group bacterium]|nr:DUF4870 domain-containing protein [Patescibacteria group bacterium]